MSILNNCPSVFEILQQISFLSIGKILRHQEEKEKDTSTE